MARRPTAPYFAGCSNGGRHARGAATRYFADYDGILAGAPGHNPPQAAVANLAGARLYQTLATVPVTDPISLATAMTDAERKLLADAVAAKCDTLDGVADGMGQDFGACQARFSLATDAPTCGGARDRSCLNGAQKSVLATVFSGPRTGNGGLMYSSFPFDAGFGAGKAGVPSGGSPVGSGIAFWRYCASTNRDPGSTGIIFQASPANPVGFDPFHFALTTDLDALYAGIMATSATCTESAMSCMTPPNPTRMQGLRERGGKIMVYHGVSDPIFSFTDTEAWYKGVQKGAGTDFARLYPVPGMGHCSGGPATDPFDLLTPLVNWVEKGIEPQEVLAGARGTGNAGGVNSDVPLAWAADRTRPLCTYPKVARYKGRGSTELASSFGRE